jgi:tRNA (guanine37-N1)-methyltransferase
MDTLPKISLAPFLATHMEEFQGIHPRIKIVRDLPLSSWNDVEATRDFASSTTRIIAYDFHGEDKKSIVSTSGESKQLKLILLHPQRVLYGLTTLDMTAPKDPTHVHPSNSLTSPSTSLKQAFPGMDLSLLTYLDSLQIQPGPTISLSIPYQQQSVHKILASVLPPPALPAPTGFEQIGHVIHLNLKKKHLPYRNMIGEILLDRFQPIIQTIVNKVGEVSGPFRTYDMEVLAGKPDTMVQLVEDGIRLKFDLRNVYWCTRLSGERSFLMEEEFQPNQILVDAFCGVGALCLQAAQKLNATVYANDLNPDAIQYFQDNVKSNGIKLMRPEYPFVSRSVDTVSSTKKRKKEKRDSGGAVEVKEKNRSIHITCSDAFEFLQNVGWMNPLPNHIVMNFPLDSITFLGALRWWPSDLVHESLYDAPPLVHLYTFAHADDDGDILTDGLPPRDVMNVAIDLVADGLIPEGGALEKCRFRKSELDKMGCDVRAREVRDVAPGKVVVCVSLKVTYQLIRVMKGDYIN